jgi:hypothetical protein
MKGARYDEVRASPHMNHGHRATKNDTLTVPSARTPLSHWAGSSRRAAEGSDESPRNA